MAEERSLAGRIAVVTGAANGMGRVMARALAGAGAKVAAVDHDAAGLDRLAAEPVFAGECLKAIGDVSKTADCRQTIERVLERIGAFLMARFAARPMIERGWGRIITVTTSFDTMLAAGLSAYGASKAALEASCVSFA